MGLSNAPRLTTDGLVFLYDERNIKSYKGPTIENKTQYLTVSTSSGTGQSYIGSTEEAYIPSLGKMLVKTVRIQNDYPTTSGDCCPSPVQYGNGISVSPSTLYTYLILYKIESGYTNSNYMYRYEYTASNGSYVTEQGVHNDSNRIHLGDGWYYAWGTFTTNASTNWLGYCAAFYYRYSTSYDKFWVAKAAIIQGNWSGLHPKYWPSPGETRSNTQSIVDITNRSINTTNNLLYNSDGTFSFIGGDATSTITVPLSTGFNKLTGTIGMWVNPSSYSGSNGLFVNRDNNTANAIDWFWIGSWDSANVFYFRLGNGSDCCSNDLTLSSWASFCPTNTWTYVTCSWSSAGTSRIYTNGILRASRSISAIPATNPSATGRIGLGHESPASWNGKIAVTQIYNRQLTDVEILSNFNSMRGRFNI